LNYEFDKGVFDVRCIPGTRTCLVATTCEVFELFSVDEGKVLDSFTGHISTVSSVKVYGDYVLSGSDDETVKVWSLQTRECIHTFSAEGIVYDLRLCENRLVAGVTGNTRAFLRIWNFKKRKHLFDIPITETPTRLFSLSVLPSKIYCCTKDGVFCVAADTAKGREKEGKQRCVLQ